MALLKYETKFVSVLSLMKSFISYIHSYCRYNQHNLSDPSSRSAKYQACILETTAHLPPDQATTPQQDISPPAEASLDNQSSITSLPPEDTDTSTRQDDPANDGKTQVEHETSTNEPKPVGQEKDTPIEQEAEEVKHSDKDQEKQPVSVDQTQMLKPRKDKLARLRELGLDPPPVAKLCADDGAFVQLELPQENPGEILEMIVLICFTL